MTTTEDRRRAMVDQMSTAGYLRTLPWMTAFASVPRHLFVPRFFRQTPDCTGWTAVSARDDGWLDTVYTDTTLVTQLDNDPDRWRTAAATGQPVTGVPTSSSTAPGLMALMLEALDVYEDAKVLEIGTGTGYNSALLSHRLHSRLVTSVEIDPAMADAARVELTTCGYHPTLIIADGAGGYPGNAPYDRIIATCSIPTVPAPWARQLRPGGLLLTNLHRDLGGGALVLLRRIEDDHLQGGFLLEYGGFMPVRSDPPADVSHRLADALATDETQTDSRPTTVAAADLDHLDFGMLAALRLPGVASMEFEPDTGPQTWLLAADGSWASIDQTTLTVTQHGPQRLWDTVETVHHQWTDAGQPTRDRYGLTVTTSGAHHFWLDWPDNIWWTQPTGQLSR